MADATIRSVAVIAVVARTCHCAVAGTDYEQPLMTGITACGRVDLYAPWFTFGIKTGGPCLAADFDKIIGSAVTFEHRGHGIHSITFCY